MANYRNESIDVLVSAAFQKAAVVGFFDPLALVAGISRTSKLDTKTEDQILDGLASSIEEVCIGASTFWQLMPGPRRSALGLLASRDELKLIISETEPHAEDKFGRILQSILLGNEVTDHLTINHLSAKALAIDFTKDLSLPMPKNKGSVDPRILLARHAERRRQNYVAPPVLFGREDISSALDAYIRDGSLLSPIERYSSGVEDVNRLRPLLLTGIGGSGKSAVIADLMRRSQKEDWSGSVVVYLDFDQRNIALGGEREWLNEISRQIGMALPELDSSLSAARRNAGKALHTLAASRNGSDRLSGTDTLTIVSTLRDEIAKALNVNRRKPRTLVIIVDTFEEVVVRSNMAAKSLEQEIFGLVLEMIASLPNLVSRKDQAFSAVRAIVAGRAAPLDDPAPASFWFHGYITVDQLGGAAAALFLQSRGERAVFTTERARRIAAKVPTYPLILILLCAFAKGRTGAEIDEAIADPGLGEVFSAPAATQILYSRFLERLTDHEILGDDGVSRRVHREDLIRLAHPGLVLPIVTPALIMDVLVIPTGLGTVDFDYASALFKALAKEIWLVQRVSAVAIRHIPVLRRIMLPMLHTDPTIQHEHIRPMRDIVHDVHAAAARWYRTGSGRLEQGARAFAAYHNAFIGDTTALVSDPSLARQVFDLAGEDVLVMPIESRAIIRNEALSGAVLSAAETASLPIYEQTTVMAEKLGKRSQSGVTSRQIEDESRTPRNADPTEITYEASANLNAPSAISAEVSGIDHSRLVDASFAEADFATVVHISGPQIFALFESRGPNDDYLQDDITSHWIWKWALSALAVSDGVHQQESTVKWLEDIVVRAKVSNWSAMLMGAAVVASGGLASRGSLPQLSPHAERMLRSSSPMGLTTMRLLALINYWEPQTPEVNPQRYFIKPQAIRFGALWEKIETPAGQRLPGPGQLVNLSVALREDLASFEVNSPSMSELTRLDNGTPIAVPLYDQSIPASLPVQPNTRQALGLLLRGRTPELFDPVRAVLGDAAAKNSLDFRQAVAEISELAPFWPSDLSMATLGGQIISREFDFFLARLVTFLDFAGLTTRFLSLISDRGDTGPRFKTVSDLLNRYDKLLLEPYDAYGCVPLKNQ